LRVINLGLELFAQELEAEGVVAMASSCRAGIADRRREEQEHEPPAICRARAFAGGAQTVTV